MLLMPHIKKKHSDSQVEICRSGGENPYFNSPHKIATTAQFSLEMCEALDNFLKNINFFFGAHSLLSDLVSHFCVTFPLMLHFFLPFLLLYFNFLF
jgi:hypothetical protein